MWTDFVRGKTYITGANRVKTYTGCLRGKTYVTSAIDRGKTIETGLWKFYQPIIYLVTQSDNLKLKQLWYCFNLSLAWQSKENYSTYKFLEPAVF